MQQFLSSEQEKNLLKAIENAELKTSGEIKLHLESYCIFDPIMRAKRIFEKLEMHKTKQKNGVLIYIAVKSKKFAIIGDAGINDRVGQDFWNDTKEKMQAAFRNKNFYEGMLIAIENAGEKLSLHFPLQSDDKNELSNTISFGN